MVPLFATPPFRNTAPFSQHFFDEWKFCLGTPFRNTSEKTMIYWSENIDYENIICENINYFLSKSRFRPRISTWYQVWPGPFINLGHFWPQFNLSRGQFRPVASFESKLLTLATFDKFRKTNACLIAHVAQNKKCNPYCWKISQKQSFGVWHEY